LSRVVRRCSGSSGRRGSLKAKNSGNLVRASEPHMKRCAGGKGGSGMGEQTDILCGGGEENQRSMGGQ